MNKMTLAAADLKTILKVLVDLKPRMTQHNCQQIWPAVESALKSHPEKNDDFKLLLSDFIAKENLILNFILKFLPLSPFTIYTVDFVYQSRFKI